MTTEKQRQKQIADTEPVIAALVGTTLQPQAADRALGVDTLRPGTSDTEIFPLSHLDGEHCAMEQKTSRHAVMPGSSDEGADQISVLPGNGSLLKRAWSGLWKFLRKIVGLQTPQDFPKVDPLNGKDHCFTRVEYVSRWALVEFGVICPKCDAAAASPGQFKRIWNTADGEAITCPECKSTLLACPTTEKEEHLLEYSDALHKFARKRHPFSPYSSQEAAEIRETLPKRLAKDPLYGILSEERRAEIVQAEELVNSQLAGEKPASVLKAQADSSACKATPMEKSA